MVPAGSDQVPTLEVGFDDVAWAELIRARVRDQTRLAAVASTGLVDTELEEVFDRLTRLAAVALGVRWAFVTLVDDRRSFWKSCFGTGAVEIADRANPVEESFCQYVVASGTALLIDDARLDPRTRTNPLIEKMGVLAWAGAPVVSASGQVLGTFCVVDSRPLSPSLVAVIVGDVCGHGIEAAATMAQLRGAMNTVVRLFHDTLADVFTHAELLRADTRDFIATIAVHLIDVSTGIVRYVSAGHPPTIIVRVDGTMELLEEGRRPVFGLGAPGRTVGTTSLGRGDALVAYTDGLVETREHPLDHGIDQVASTVRRTLGRSATETAQAIERQTPRQRTDDVAFIVATRTAARP